LRSLIAILILGAAFLVGGCNSSSSSTAPSVAPVPTVAAPSIEPEVSASPS
jgi:hypothetical protein